MIRNTELGAVTDALIRKNPTLAFELLENYGYKYPELNLIQPLGDIKADYALMIKYWQQGYKDSQMEVLFHKILQRTYRLTTNACLHHIIQKTTTLSNIRNTNASSHEWNMSDVRADMENFTAELALLELEPPHKRNQRRVELYTRHDLQINDLFNNILLSPQWSDSMCEEMTEMLLSPTIDIDDRMLTASAITMSLTLVFDFNKWKTLTNVCQRETDERLRQRAMVGWVITLGEGYCDIFTEQAEIVGDILAKEGAVEELTALQMQMVYCANAENDNRIIRDEIMPDLIKHNNLQITPDGIEEKEDATMDDVLDFSASERKMEELEEKIKRMTDMQKSGVDIYFGGFSQMKRFPFFDNISHWFAPFNIAHPAVSALYDRQTDIDMVNMIVNRGSFCDSDKYSFALAFQKAVNQMPAHMREMLSSGDIHMGMEGNMNAEERNSRTFIRQSYLQNVYRFFRLYPSRESFDNPFASIFFGNRIFEHTLLKEKASEIAAFLIKRHLYDEAATVLDRCATSLKDYNYCMLCAYISTHITPVMLNRMKRLSNLSAQEWYGKALDSEPDSPKAMSGYGRELMKNEDYELAEAIYSRLLAVNEHNMSAMFNHAQCLLALRRYDEALKEAYRLDYECPDKERVVRLLARVQMQNGDMKQARRQYDRLCDMGKRQPADNIGMGIIEWCEGNMADAAALFTTYVNVVCLSSTTQGRYECCERDIIVPNEDILSKHGINTTEVLLMKSIIAEQRQ